MKMHGICFSVGQNPAVVSESLKTIANDAHVIRTYSPEPYEAEARSLGLDVVPGAWLDKNTDANERTIAALIESANRFKPKLVVVGNETQFRGDFAPEVLIAYMRRVKAAVPAGTSVTTADVAAFLLRAPEVIEESDVIGMHHYPFWDGVHIDRSVGDFVRMYHRVKMLGRGKPLAVLETGWPSDGGCKGEAEASVENAEHYFRGVMNWSTRSGVPIFWFSAYNEAWKVPYEGPPGGHWGLRPCAKTPRKYWHQ